MKAIWNGEVVAESNETVIIEGNHYFPKASINKAFFKPTNTQTRCHWKGMASYYTLDVNGKQNIDAAWYYPETSEMAKSIEGYIAFWKGVEVRN